MNHNGYFWLSLSLNLYCCYFLFRYRKVNGSFMTDNEYRQENGSYVFPNITAADSAYASGDGVEYYCTASNDFGTIRSRTVTAFYAGE